jgi:hypothetical protein
MPAWNAINQEIDAIVGPVAADKIRKKYLNLLEAVTGRPVIGYYSGWLWKRDKEGRSHPECAISDLDMNGFMALIELKVSTLSCTRRAAVWKPRGVLSNICIKCSAEIFVRSCLTWLCPQAR